MDLALAFGVVYEPDSHVFFQADGRVHGCRQPACHSVAQRPWFERRPLEVEQQRREEHLADD
jgi:hypothetical protein